MINGNINVQAIKHLLMLCKKGNRQSQRVFCYIFLVLFFFYLKLFLVIIVVLCNINITLLF